MEIEEFHPTEWAGMDFQKPVAKYEWPMDI